jgi:VWFA-related protein
MESAVFRTGLGISFAACVVAWLAAGQDQPVFKTTTTYVRVDVVVTGKDDRPVTDLTVGDFEIRERHRLQTITDFERISVPLGNRPIDDGAALAPAPDVFSNTPPPRSGRAFVFVLHLLQPKDIVPIKRLMIEFLRTLSADDTVALVYPSRSDLSQDFTKDAGLLIRAVDNLNGAFGSPVRSFWDPYMKDVLRTLASARENRRAIVLVSNGMPISARSAVIIETFDLARRLNIPIYTIDPRGLMAPELGFEGHMEDQTPGSRMALDTAIFYQQQGMRTIAENTNGRAFVNNWNLTQAAHDLVGDNSSYYLLGFYPSPDVRDGKFHEIDVTVKRPGLRVRARSGYTSEPPRSPAARPPRTVEALGAGLPGGDLLLRATVASLAPSRRGASTLITLDVAYPDAAGRSARTDDQLHLVWIAIDADARITASGRNTVPLSLTGTSADAVAFSLNELIDLPKGRLTVRMGVSSRALGKQGTVHVPVDVHAFGGRALDASPILLGLASTLPVPRPVVGSTAGIVPFHPTTSRTFSAGQRLRAFVRVFSRRADGLTTDLVLKQGDRILRRVPVEVAPATSVRNAVDCEAEVVMPDLPPGRYILDFTASRPAGNAVHRAVQVDVR